MNNRILFTPKSIAELKHSLTNCIRILDDLFWYEIPMELYDHFDESMTAEQADAHITIEPFKPARMKLYNSTAAILGYKNWRELETISSTQEIEQTQSIFLAEHTSLHNQFDVMFQACFFEQFKLPEDSLLKDYFARTVKVLCPLVTRALVLNANATEGNIPNIDIEDNNLLFGIAINGNEMHSSNNKLNLYCAFEDVFPDVIPLTQWQCDPSSLPLMTFIHDIFTESKLQGFEMFSKHLLLTKTNERDVVYSIEHDISLGSEDLGKAKYVEYNSKMSGIATLCAMLMAKAEVMGMSPIHFRSLALKATSKAELRSYFA